MFSFMLDKPNKEYNQENNFGRWSRNEFFYKDSKEDDRKTILLFIIVICIFRYIQLS